MMIEDQILLVAIEDVREARRKMTTPQRLGDLAALRDMKRDAERRITLAFRAKQTARTGASFPIAS